MNGDGWQKLGLTGDETVSIGDVDDIKPMDEVEVHITMTDGSVKTITTKVRIDTENELEYYKNGGILHYVLRNLAREDKAAA